MKKVIVTLVELVKLVAWTVKCLFLTMGMCLSLVMAALTAELIYPVMLMNWPEGLWLCAYMPVVWVWTSLTFLIFFTRALIAHCDENKGQLPKVRKD